MKINKIKMERYSPIVNACFSGQADSDPKKIRENNLKGKYVSKEDKYSNLRIAAVNPYSGRCVFNNEYTRLSEDGDYVKDICVHSDKLNLNIRIDLTQLPDVYVPNTELGKQHLKILIKWIENCISAGKKLPFTYDYVDIDYEQVDVEDNTDDCEESEDNECDEDDECNEDDEEDDDDDDEFIEDDDYHSADSDYIEDNDEDDNNDDDDDIIIEINIQTKRRRLN